MHVIIVGCGRVAARLATGLALFRHDVLVVDKDPESFSNLGAAFNGSTVTSVGIDADLLEQAGIAQADALAATIARVNNPKNRQLFHRLGINLAASSTALIADLIEREIASEHLRTLLTLNYGQVQLVEVSLPPQAAAAHQRVSDLARCLPPSSILVAVVRGEQVLLPRGETQLLPGDNIMALTPTGTEETLRRTLLGKAAQD